MEILNIEKSAFEMMMTRFKQFADKVERVYSKHNSRELAKWLDNQDMCEMLNISKRTLQSYRDNGLIAYTQIDHKIYYKAEDVQRFINEKTIK